MIPKSPGCWIYLLHGCSEGYERGFFQEDTDFSRWQPIKEAEDRTSCEMQKNIYDDMCGVYDAMVEFVGNVPL